MQTYYLALIDGGVNPNEYSFEKLISDYRTYGFAQIVARFIGFTAYLPAEYYPTIFDRYVSFVNIHELTPEEMVPPMYGWF